MSAEFSDYLPLVQTYLQHWEKTEEELSSSLVLGEGSTIDSLRTLHEDYATAQETLRLIEERWQIAMGTRDNARLEALPTARQVRKDIIARIPGAPELQALPKEVPAALADVQKQLLVLQTIADIWGTINGFPAGKYPGLTPPLVAQVAIGKGVRSVTLAQFQEMNATLGQAGEQVKLTEQDRKAARQARKTVQGRIESVLTAYTKTIRGRFPATSDVVLTLPKRP